MAPTRRTLLMGGAAGVAAAAAGAVLMSNRLDTIGLKDESNRFFTALPIPPLLDAREAGNIVRLIAKAGVTEFLPNLETETYGYSAPYLGPVIRVHRGDTVTMDVSNQLDKVTTVHWHGLFVPSELDGGPHNAINPGQTWQPRLKIEQPASTAWFHPHPHGDTGRQVYMGLAGLLYVEDGSAEDLGLPTRYGLDDLPIILQDRSFGPDGELVYDDTPMGIMHGARGDAIIVNGAMGPVAEVPKSVVRLRLVNAANARNFRLEFDDRRPMHVVASDNGFLDSTVAVRELTIAPGERFEVLVDFSNGQTGVLLTYADHNGQFGSEVTQQVRAYLAQMMDIMTPVIRFDPVAEIKPAVNRMPTKLVDLRPAGTLQPPRRRSFSLDSMTAANMPLMQDEGSMQGMDHSQMAGTMDMGAKSGLARGMKMGINGKAFDMNRIDAELKVGDKEIWELRSTEMAHPFHMHGASFRILTLDGAKPAAHLSGWKDTLLVNEHAEILVSFDQPAGPTNPFMFHCHILEHEDAGMMAQYVAV